MVVLILGYALLCFHEVKCYKALKKYAFKALKKYAFKVFLGWTSLWISNAELKPIFDFFVEKRKT
jgi:hypothetical protein